MRVGALNSAAVVLASAAIITACGDRAGKTDSDAQPATGAFRTLIPEMKAPPREAAIATLSDAEPSGYTADATLSGYTLSGSVTAAPGIAGDTVVRPTHDLSVCKPFNDVFMPRKGVGVGNAIVWINGIVRGKPQSLPRRTNIQLKQCRLEPRVHVVATGGAVIAGSGDRMISRIRVFDVLTGSRGALRALIPFSDFGQVVPISPIADSGGLYEVTDDMHPWVRGFIAVSSHPYIAVSDATGAFSMDGVPAGDYEIVIFSEALGTMRRMVSISHDTAISLEFE